MHKETCEASQNPVGISTAPLEYERVQPGHKILLCTSRGAHQKERQGPRWHGKAMPTSIKASSVDNLRNIHALGATCLRIGYMGSIELRPYILYSKAGQAKGWQARERPKQTVKAEKVFHAFHAGISSETDLHARARACCFAGPKINFRNKPLQIVQAKG